RAMFDRDPGMGVAVDAKALDQTNREGIGLREVVAAPETNGNDCCRHVQLAPNTRLKIVSTCLRWKPRSKRSASSASERYFLTSGSCFRKVRKSPPPRQTFIAWRCTSL